MRFHLVYATLGLAGAFGVPAAQAQAVITTAPTPVVIAQPPLVTAPAPVVAQPAESARTTRTVRTVRTMVPVRQRIVTTRTVTRRVMPAEPAIATTAVAAGPAPQPLYDVAPAAAITPAADISPPPAYGYGYRAAPAYDYGYRAPAYDYAYRAPAYDYAPPLYDVAPAPVVIAPAAVAPAPVVAAPAAAIAPGPVIAAPVATAPVIYRYVYEPDRILVIDPTTNIAVQAIPR